MSPLWLLIVLLLVAYLGSILVRGRGLRGMGLPSGAEYVLIGFLCGRHVFGLASPAALATFAPLALAAVAWLAFLLGLGYGKVDGRSLRAGPASAGIGFALVTALVVWGVVYGAAQAFTAYRGVDLWLLSAGAAVVLCESTRKSVQWVIERHDARGPVADFLADVAGADDAVPLLLTTLLIAFEPSQGLALGFVARALAPFGIGLAVAAVVAVLIGREARWNESWGLLLGGALLATGVAATIGVSVVTTAFVLGLGLARFSHHRDELRAMIAPTEQPVLQPVLLLAGAWIAITPTLAIVGVMALALAARIAVRFALGAVLGRAATAGRAREGLGGALLSSGALSVALALALAIRFEREAAHAVLALAALSALLGEIFGPHAMRRALERAGEVVVAVAAAPPLPARARALTTLIIPAGMFGAARPPAKPAGAGASPPRPPVGPGSGRDES